MTTTFQTITTGAGTLELGKTSSDYDVPLQHQVKAAKITYSHSTGDQRTVLSGEVKLGAVKSTASLEVEFYSDFGLESSIVEYSRANHGEELYYKFIPNTTNGKSVTGQLVMTALDVGGEVGEEATVSATWDCLGLPEYSD